jgi:hypothetical protein
MTQTDQLTHVELALLPPDAAIPTGWQPNRQSRRDDSFVPGLPFLVTIPTPGWLYLGVPRTGGHAPFSSTT